MGKKNKYKNKFKEARNNYIIQHEEWKGILKQKCHYYAIAYLMLCLITPLVFILRFEVNTAFILMGCTWFIASIGYFLMFKHYATTANKDFYNLLLKSRYGNGTMVAAVFKYSIGGIIVMIILGTIAVYHWIK